MKPKTSVFGRDESVQGIGHNICVGISGFPIWSIRCNDVIDRSTHSPVAGNHEDSPGRLGGKDYYRLPSAQWLFDGPEGVCWAHIGDKCKLRCRRCCRYPSCTFSPIGRNGHGHDAWG